MLKYGEVRKWLNGRGKGTRMMYLMTLRFYCQFTGLNPTQLIDEAEADRAKDRRHRFCRVDG